VSLTAAEHRGLRELYASARQLASHWVVLADRLGGDQGAALRNGAAEAEELLDELAGRMEEHGLAGFPAARSAGGSVSSLRNRLDDAALERNQALRLAVLDVQHLGTLLPYLARLARTRGDERLARWHGGWKRRLAAVEKQARELAVEAGAEPDAAVEPLIDSPAGRVAHGVQFAIGSIGEWVDTSAVGRGARRVAKKKR